MGIRVLFTGKQEEQDILKECLERLWAEIEWVTADEDSWTVYMQEKSQAFDLVFLDVSMRSQGEAFPDKEIRKRWPECQIIYLTDYWNFNFLMKHADLGNSDYLLKPLSQTGAGVVLQKARTRYLAQAGQKLQAENISQTDGKGSRIPDEQWKLQVTEYLEGSLQDSLTLKKAGQMFGTSETYFCKRFKRLFGEGFVDYITRMRIEKAKKLLEETALEVREIACQTGFGDAAYFTKIFKRETGSTPTEYRYKNIAI